MGAIVRSNASYLGLDDHVLQAVDRRRAGDSGAFC
jgi:hypothetical protein